MRKTHDGMINVNDKLIKEDLGKMKPNAFAVLMAITIHIDRRNKAFPSLDRLKRLTGLGKDAVYAALGVLIEMGYLSRRQENKAGKFGKTIYTVTTKYLSVWINCEGEELEEEQSEEIPLTENPDTEEPHTVNPPLSINKDLSIREELSNNVEQNSTQDNSDLVKLDKRLSKANKKHREAIIEIVDYFRAVSGKSKTAYSTKGALGLMLYWLNDGKTVDDFKKVIDFKTAEFNRTGNTQYISIDTYCREKKFEDTLQKVEALAEIPEEIQDCELTETEKAEYNQIKTAWANKFPEAFRTVPFFTFSEFKKYKARDFYTKFPYQYTERLFQIRMKDILNGLEQKPWERKNVSSLFDYTKQILLKTYDNEFRAVAA